MVIAKITFPDVWCVFQIVSLDLIFHHIKLWLFITLLWIHWEEFHKVCLMCDFVFCSIFFFSAASYPNLLKFSSRSSTTQSDSCINEFHGGVIFINFYMINNLRCTATPSNTVFCLLQEMQRLTGYNDCRINEYLNSKLVGSICVLPDERRALEIQLK